MPWINANFTVQDAIARGSDTWDLLVTNWGANGASPAFDTTSLVFPAEGLPALPGPAAMAIGPQSTIDRCWVVWDIQKLLPTSSLWDYPHRLSVDTPLIFPQAASQRLVASSKVDAGASSIMILPGSSLATADMTQLSDFTGTRFGITYQKTDGTSATFGPAAAGWRTPLLHIVYYLRAPVTSPSMKRFPLAARFAATPVAGSEQLVAQVPVYGRKTIVVSVTIGAAADIRLGLIQTLSESPPPRENTVFSQLAVPATSTVRAVISPALGDYLMCYVNWTGLASTIVVNVTATDT